MLTRQAFRSDIETGVSAMVGLNQLIYTVTYPLLSGVITFNADAGQYILEYDTAGLAPGEYDLYIGLANGGGMQVIRFTIAE